MDTNIEPMTIIFPPLRKIRKARKLINKTNTSQRNHFFVKTRGGILFRLNFDITISRNAPLGQKFQHQYLPLKKERTKRIAIMATTKYPSMGMNNPPMTISGSNQTIIAWLFFIMPSLKFLLPQGRFPKNLFALLILTV
jgi:hypothetical protein